jgi:hypothetical protein
MKLLVLGAVLAATVMGALPATAQVVIQERSDRDRVVVREHMDNGRHEGWRRSHADCRVVRVKTRMPNGNVIIKTRRSC